jgi:hypothetical protein
MRSLLDIGEKEVAQGGSEESDSKEYRCFGPP